MDSNEFRFEGFNPILSFTEGSIGVDSQRLIDLNSQPIDAPRELWAIGFKAFKHFLFKPNCETEISFKSQNLFQHIRIIHQRIMHFRN